MKTDTKIMPPEVLLEEYRRLLLSDPSVEALPLVITGNSMSPFLIHGRDTVYLSRLTRPVRRGDMLLYQRRSGGYVLHRVYRAAPEGLTMIGDAQTILEPGIRREQVIAIVTRVERKGKPLTPGSFWWEFFEKIWIRIVPLRRWVHRLYTLLHRK
ncbi:MAG: S24/S26 family peptidase [Faecousia sp.]